MSKSSLVLAGSRERPRYAVCTIFTRRVEYAEMQDSFVSHGFDPVDTEFLFVDNSERNISDAFRAYNAFLSQAKSPYIILCHQDITLLQDGRTRLDEIIYELNELDSNWGLFGNAGAKLNHTFAIRISDPHGESRCIGGPFPARAATLDENFIVVRQSANLLVSHDLEGFHMYGPDLCLCAEIMGYHSYVVDFHLRHKSGGTKDSTFWRATREFQNKYRRALQSDWCSVLQQKALFR